MVTDRSHILSKLRQEINSLGGAKRPASQPDESRKILGPIADAFIKHDFPAGCLNEVICDNVEDRAAGIGFLSVLLSSFIKSGILIWISRETRVFPPALPAFSIDPAQIIFIKVRNSRDLVWVIEESLRCPGLAAVIGEMPELDFNTSRRFQLAVEKSRVTAFIIRERSCYKTTTASTAKWKVLHLPSIMHDELPGIGFPVWRIELIRLRNGKAGKWDLVFRNGQLESLSREKISMEEQRKTG